MKNVTYLRFAGLCAILSGIGGVLYGIAFVILGNQLLFCAVDVGRIVDFGRARRSV